MNGTQRAIDLIPRNSFICDWHYSKRSAYASIPHLIDHSLSLNDGKMLGQLYTTWRAVAPDALHSWEPLVRAVKIFDEKR